MTKTTSAAPILPSHACATLRRCLAGGIECNQPMASGLCEVGQQSNCVNCPVAAMAGQNLVTSERSRSGVRGFTILCNGISLKHTDSHRKTKLRAWRPRAS